MTDELEILAQGLTWGDIPSSGAEVFTSVVDSFTQHAMPELVVKVQNLGSGTDFAGSIAHYLPFVAEYSDGQLLIFWLVVLLRILGVVWTLRDAIARSESVFYQLFSALLVAVLTPVIGIPLYLAFRPLVYRWERGIWREALEQQIVLCTHCQNLNAEAHQMCVWCWEALQVECKQCHRKFQGQFDYCPECWAPNLE